VRVQAKGLGWGVVQEAKPRNRMTKTFVCFHVTDGKTQIITPNFMIKLKKFICEAPILLLHKISEIGVNFIFFLS
jgi:hypothetical protein